MKSNPASAGPGSRLTVLPVGAQIQSAALPFVFVNMAMTADGKIATANREVASFGSPRDLAHLYALRATADAVMCGAQTASAPDVRLDPGGERFRRRRRRHGLAEFNLRVLVTGSGALDPATAIFATRFSPIIVLTTGKAGRRKLDRLKAVADEVVVCGTQELDFRAALAHLRSQWGVRRLLCEGGGELNEALFRAGLVHELHLTICPFVFGGREAPTIAEGVGAASLGEATQLRLSRRRRVGDELFCVFVAAG